MTNRVDKVNSLLEHEIAVIIQRDVFFQNVLVTLTHVEATANLIDAKVFISALPEQKMDQVIEILRKNVYDIQQKINHKLKMRPIPKIIFVADRKVSEAGKIEELLHKIKVDSGN